jgi:hypothetical protein
MSAEQALMPEDPQMTQATIQIGNKAERGAPASQEVRFRERRDEPDLVSEEPLNAEEATILVLHFLRRMRKHVVTPRKAALNEENVYVVDVDLKDATATVHINADTREILEYTIEQHPKEPKPLPISPRKMIIGFGAVVAFIAVIWFHNFLIVFAQDIIETVPSDYFLIGGAVLLIVIGVVWWRRRAA